MYTKKFGSHIMPKLMKENQYRERYKSEKEIKKYCHSVPFNPNYAIEITKSPTDHWLMGIHSVCIDAPLGALQIRCKHP
jgi:hypothetical protein